MIFHQDTHEMPERAAIVGRTLRDGEYEVKRLVGSGEVARVFLATHTTLLISLALKQIPCDQPLAEAIVSELDALLAADEDDGLLTPSRRSVANELPPRDDSTTNRFAREALLLARLRHPAIPMLYDYFYEDGYWYLIMDYVPGYSLDSYLKRNAPLSALEALSCALQICDTLDYLHTRTPALTYPDLTAHDLMVTPTGMIVLVGLGTAIYAQLALQEETPTAIQGGPDEQDHRSPLPVSSPAARYSASFYTDVSLNLYSLGQILRTMLYGASGRPGAHISSFLRGLIGLATRAEAKERFQSAHTFYLALERAYQVEEQHTFNKRLTQQEDALEYASEHGAGMDAYTPAQLEDDGQLAAAWEEREDGDREMLSTLASHTLELEQRQLTRTALQRARQERQRHEQIELQLASVDESLGQRSSVSLARISLPPIARSQAPAPATLVSSLQRFQRIIKINFMLALILCLLMVSLLAYARVAQPLADDINTLLRRALPSSGQRSGDNTASQETSDTPGAGTLQQTPDPHNTPGTHSGLAESYWQALPALPGAQADNTAVYVELQGRSYIYLSGGYHASSPLSYDHNLYRYDIAAAHWETVNAAHFPGMVNNAAAIDEQGHIFFSAGYSSDTHTVPSLLYRYDPATDILQSIATPAQMPLGFAAAMLADHQGHLYLTQGFMRPGRPGEQAGTGWYRFDIATAQWHQLAAPPLGLGYVFIVGDGRGGILLLGGASDAGQRNASNKIYRYDIATDSWTQATESLPQAISGAAGCQPWPGKLVLVGGYDAQSGTGNRATWLLDLHTLKWRSLPDLTIGGSVLGAAACDGTGHLFLERGTTTPRQPTADFWQLVVSTNITVEN